MEEKIHYVYLTTNLISGKQYIGDHTINFNEKKYYLGSGVDFSNAVQKFKSNNFFKEILEWFPTRREAFNAQEKYIKLYKTHVSQGGYNISWTGGTNCGGSHSKETKIKISKSQKGKQNIIGEKNPFFGKHHTEETKKWLKIKSTGQIRSKEVKEKISLRTSGINNPMYGKHLTEEQKEKLRKPKSIETKNKLSKIQIGKYQAEKNPMYGKSLYDIWMQKYGEEEANERYKKWKECKKGQIPWNKGMKNNKLFSL